jgi:transposase
MEAKDLFTLAVQLTSEWKVTDCLLDQQARRLTLKLDFKAGSKFCAPGAAHQLLCPVHDTVETRWRHLDFFQYQTELVARVPRVKTPDGTVVQGGGAVGPAWERVHFDVWSVGHAAL